LTIISKQHERIYTAIHCPYAR